VDDVSLLPLDELEERVETAEAPVVVAGLARHPGEPRLRRFPKQILVPRAGEFLLDRVMHLRSFVVVIHKTKHGADFFRPGYSPAPMVARRLAPFALLVLLAACGNPVHSHYSVKQTAPCLRKLGYEVDTDAASLGPVEASAAEGALRAKEKGNALVITFAEDASGARNLEAGYRRFVGKRLRGHLRDVMSSQKNVVLLWTITPPEAEMNRVLGCLR
jgi:hypothetical protein